MTDQIPEQDKTQEETTALLSGVDAKTNEVVANDKPKFSIYSDISDLPPELIKELNLDAEDLVDQKIIELLKKGGGTLELNEVLIGYYRMYGEIKTRRYMTTRLYRLLKKKVIESAGKKGQYRLVSDQDRS